MDNCKIVFSILDRSSFDILSFSILLVFLIVLLFVHYTTKRTFLGYVITIVTFIGIIYITIDNSISFYINMNNLKKIYTNKQYKEVIGKISDYKEKKIKAGYVMTAFRVKNVEFKYDTIQDDGGYSKTKNEGSILENNQTVKIRYMDKDSNDTKNIILHLEVCKNRG